MATVAPPRMLAVAARPTQRRPRPSWASATSRVLSGGGRRRRGRPSPRERETGEEEEERADSRADQLPAHDPGGGVANELGKVTERLDLLSRRDRPRLVVPAEDGRNDERGGDRAHDRTHHHEDEDCFHDAPPLLCPVICHEGGWEGNSGRSPWGPQGSSATGVRDLRGYLFFCIDSTRR